MPKLKPHRVNLYFYYRCECGAEYSQTFQEVKLIGKIVCEVCGKLLELEKMDSVHVEPKYNSSSSVQSPIISNTKTVNKNKTTTQQISINNQLVDLIEISQPVISSLKDLGFTKSQAKDIINKVITINTVYPDITAFYTKCVESLYELRTKN
jgi:uncharacterized Zn finger protein (UPF0148 family)